MVGEGRVLISTVDKSPVSYEDCMTFRGPLTSLKVQMKERAEEGELRKQNGSDHNGKWEGTANGPRFCCAAAISRFRTARAMGEARVPYTTSASANAGAGCG